MDMYDEEGRSIEWNYSECSKDQYYDHVRFLQERLRKEYIRDTVFSLCFLIGPVALFIFSEDYNELAVILLVFFAIGYSNALQGIHSMNIIGALAPMAYMANKEM